MPKSTISKISDITGTLYSELLSSGAINKKDEIVKPQMFIDIIEHKEQELQKFVPEVENEAGVVTDRYTADILSGYFSQLQEMKETMSVRPDWDSKDPKAIAIEEKMMRPSEPSKFIKGIKNLFLKLRNNKTRTNPSNER
jgi:hypothetical protein